MEGRIRNAVVGEVTDTRPGRATAEEFEKGARTRLDRLLDRDYPAFRLVRANRLAARAEW